MHFLDKHSQSGDLVTMTDVKQGQHSNTNTDCTIYVLFVCGEVWCVVLRHCLKILCSTFISLTGIIQNDFSSHNTYNNNNIEWK